MIEVIPAIDIIDGKCVRLRKGDYAQKTIYSDSPLEVAKTIEDSGIRRLHLVDLDGAKAKQVVNISVLEQVASKTSLTVDYGGGIKSETDVSAAFNSGAAMITIGSIAVTDQKSFIGWLHKYGAERIILAADIRNNNIAISGWSDVTKIEPDDFLAAYATKGVTYVLCTDISKDGMLKGPSIELYKRIVSTFPELKIIASGGISDISEIDSLQRLGVYGVIIGKALYEGKISFDQLQRFL